MRIEDFNDRLKQAILVCDGGMGSLLHESVSHHRSSDELNSTHGEIVFRLHELYIQAGAQIIETNTFSANRHKLGNIGLADRVVEFNHRGVKLAREARDAAPHEVLIAGSIGPLGVFSQVRQLPAEEVLAIFKEQAGALEERGVDFFILETFSDAEEQLAAIQAIRSFSNLPIVAQMTYSQEGTTFGGRGPKEVWEQLKDKNVQAIGANCTVGPDGLLAVLRQFANQPSIPLSAMPNAGFPQRIGDRTIYPHSSPEYFALFAQEAAALGARILGGCCGTTPDHIRAMADAAKQMKLGGRGSGKHAGATVEILEPEERIRRTAIARTGKPPMGQDSGREVCRLDRG